MPWHCSQPLCRKRFQLQTLAPFTICMPFPHIPQSCPPYFLPFTLLSSLRLPPPPQAAAKVLMREDYQGEPMGDIVYSLYGAPYVQGLLTALAFDRSVRPLQVGQALRCRSSSMRWTANQCNSLEIHPVTREP